MGLNGKARIEKVRVYSISTSQLEQLFINTDKTLKVSTFRVEQGKLKYGVI